MPLALTVTDNGAAPTGVTATIAGSGGGTVTVYASQVTPYPPAMAAVGTRAGDGTLVVPLAKGAWWLAAATDAGAVAPPFAAPTFALATDGSDAPATRVRAAIAARIGLLGLTTFNGGKPLDVVPCFWPAKNGPNNNPICVGVAVDDLAERQRADVNAFDDVSYPARVTFWEPLNQGTPDVKKLPWFEAARYKVERAFQGQHLPGVPESKWCDVDFESIAADRYGGYERFSSGLVVRCHLRLPRGVNV